MHTSSRTWGTPCEDSLWIVFNDGALATCANEVWALYFIPVGIYRAAVTHYHITSGQCLRYSDLSFCIAVYFIFKIRNAQFSANFHQWNKMSV